MTKVLELDTISPEKRPCGKGFKRGLKRARIIRERRQSSFITS
jgi:hypothetical protein